MKNIRNSYPCCSASDSTAPAYHYQQIDLQVFNCGYQIKIVPFTFERIGHIVHVTHDRFYDESQISAYMYTEPIPAIFRPIKNQIRYAWVIDAAVDYGVNHLGLTYMGTATRAVGPGVIQFNTDGNIFWGPRHPDNDEYFLMFSNNGITGSGNGVLSATHTYSI